MALIPKIIGPDGVAREEFIFTTTIQQRFFLGTTDAGTVDMQVSIRGEPFTSNPDFIVFEGTSFTVPNPSVFPDGLDLVPGDNEILVRAISFSGSASTPASILARLVQQSDVDFIPTPPTNISVERFNQSVEISVELDSDSRVQGAHFFASRFTGGGAVGYQRINLDLVTDTFISEETEGLIDRQVDSSIATNPDGTPAADPLFLELRETQTKGGDTVEKLEDVTLTPDLAEAITYNEQERLLKTDFFIQQEVPETVLNIRTSITVQSVRQVTFVSFDHDRTAGPTSQPPTVAIGEFASLAISESLFYVVTVVAFDSEAQVESESPFSIEVFGNPVSIQLQLGAFPVVSRGDITQQTITQILRTQPQVALQPGAVIRDTVVDPFSGEAERIRFIVDFLHRAQSWDSLLRIDGIDGNGNSIPVQDSAYKQALQRSFGNISLEQTQAIIDASFEQLGANVGITRRPGIRARGLLTFFSATRPGTTVQFALGTRSALGGTLFSTTQEETIPFDQTASFFDPTTGLYSVDIPIEADQPGTAGNVARGQIRTLLDPIGGFQVVNPGATFGGRDVETNAELGVRGKNGLASVDSGTEAGYRQTLADVPGIEQAVVVDSGDPLMQRDFDEAADKHVGGKVDIYTRGEALATVTDTFAFTFEIAQNVQFVLIGTPTNLILQSTDPSLSETNPIAEMLDFPNADFGLRNVTTGSSFDLTDVVLVDFKTIQLSNAVVQPAVDFGDVLLGDYRFVVGREFVLPRQPVREVVSVTGAVSGELPEDNFQVFRLDNPLLDGRSTEAQTYLQINEVNGNPTGEFIQVTGEQHVVIGEFNEPVDNLGANLLTIQVFNEDRTVEYRGPFDPSGVSDYTVVPGNQTTAVAIRRVETGVILSGQTVQFDYAHDENFTVEYSINLAVRTAQEIIDGMKHVSADVLIKETVPIPIDLTGTIVKRQGFATSAVDRGVRSNIRAFTNGLSLGQSVRQSDEIAEMERTNGVSYVEVPLTKMARQSGSCVVREPLLTVQNSDITLLTGSDTQSISTNTVLVWLIEEELNAATTVGGGPVTEFRTVAKDDFDLVLQLAEPLALGSAPNQAFIIGDDGLSIPGFTDDLTLAREFPTSSEEERAEVRQERTQNRVMVSLAVGESPTNHSFTVTYIVGETNAGVKNLDAFQIEFFTVGNLNFTFDEDQTQA